jgi:hypothetical protein
MEDEKKLSSTHITFNLLDREIKLTKCSPAASAKSQATTPNSVTLSGKLSSGATKPTIVSSLL